MYSVYIVDDERLVVESLIKTVLWEENGFEVIGSHTNPVKAFDEIREKRPVVVFCDLKMPQMDGIKLVREIRRVGLECEVVMLSAFGEFEASREFFLLDGFDYLLKPLEKQNSEILLEGLARKIAKKNNQPPVADIYATSTQIFDELVCYVAANYTKRHTLKDLSSRFHLSPNYICSLFSKHYNSTLTIFLTDIRMREAARNIQETDAPLKEIAINNGYSDYFYFCRIFKSFYGVPPTEFRKNKENLKNNI